MSASKAMTRAILSLMLLLVPPAAQAQIYKWYDEQGRARYGEKPPPGVSSKLLAPPAGTSAAPKPRIEEQEADFRRRQLEKREAEEREARAAKVREQQCEQLRQELAVTEQVRLFRWERGEKVFFTEAQQKAHADKVRALIGEHCR